MTHSSEHLASHRSLFASKLLIIVVFLASLSAQAACFLLGVWNVFGWDTLRFPFQLGWTFLGFPLGWTGYGAALIASPYRAAWSLPVFCIGIGMVLNACFWTVVTYLVHKRAQYQGTFTGLDTSSISQRVHHLRSSHVLAAHERCRPFYAREELVAIAACAVRHSNFFLGKQQHSEPAG